MGTLLDKANKILDEKNSKIIPDNIKEGVQIFDITGTAETFNGLYTQHNITYNTRIENLYDIYTQDNKFRLWIERGTEGYEDEYDSNYKISFRIRSNKDPMTIVNVITLQFDILDKNRNLLKRITKADIIDLETLRFPSSYFSNELQINSFESDALNKDIFMNAYYIDNFIFEYEEELM